MHHFEGTGRLSKLSGEINFQEVNFRELTVVLYLLIYRLCLYENFLMQYAYTRNRTSVYMHEKEMQGYVGPNIFFSQDAFNITSFGKESTCSLIVLSNFQLRNF